MPHPAGPPLETASVEPTRVLLYGASNLWLSRGAALTALRRRVSGPLEIGLACGPGRSYGLRAGNLLTRYLPLREITFPESDRRPTTALLCDVGNDIAYAQQPDTTLSWVGELAERLQRQGAEVVLSGLPLESLRGLPQWLFYLLRSFYYRGQRLTRDDLIQRLEDLEGGLQSLAAERGHLFLDNDPSWYGWDRFHLRSAAYRTCWDGWMERLGSRTPQLHGIEAAQPDELALGWRELWRLTPQTYWYRGREVHAPGTYLNLLPQTRLWVR